MYKLKSITRMLYKALLKYYKDGHFSHLQTEDIEKLLDDATVGIRQDGYSLPAIVVLWPSLEHDIFMIEGTAIKEVHGLKCGQIVTIANLFKDDYEFFSIGDKARIIEICQDNTYFADFTINEKYVPDGKWYITEHNI